MSAKQKQTWTCFSIYTVRVTFLTCPGTSDASRSEGHSGDMAAVVVPVLFLLLLGVCGGLVVLYLRHRRLQNNFTAFANSHYNSRLGSAIFSSGDELGEITKIFLCVRLLAIQVLECRHTPDTAELMRVWYLAVVQTLSSSGLHH